MNLRRGAFDLMPRLVIVESGYTVQAMNAGQIKDGHSQISHGESTIQQRETHQGTSWSPGTPKKQAAVHCMYHAGDVSLMSGTCIIHDTCEKLKLKMLSLDQLLCFRNNPR